MKIFLSYPSGQRDTAESICYELQAEGHEVFFDKEDLSPGQSYNERIRGAVEESDLFIFLITPESVARGKYTLTELKIACRKWPNPTGCVLPVMVEQTPFDDIPAYLKAVTVLSPEGNLTAEVVMEVADLAGNEPPGPVGEKAPETDAPSFTYHPLEIRFGAGRGTGHAVSVTDSPVGSLPAQPYNVKPASLEQILWSSAGRIEGTVRRARVELGETNEGLLPTEDDAKNVGEQLYESLFASPLRSCLDGSMRSIDPQRGQGLRFLINTTDAPDLARLPWEFLYSRAQDDFLFSDRMKPVIRWLDVDQPPPSLVVQPPLRLLTAVASPPDRPELSVGQEIAHLDEALHDLVGEGLVETVRLEHATLEKLDDALLKEKPHVLHFIGHGDFAGEEGVIVLEAETPPGGADPITGRQLGVLLRNHLGSLRFVFLNSCLGAAVSVKDPFGGVAQSLIQRGIPAVIAMQFPIPDRVAIALARHFYRYLAAGLPVDTALTSARAFLYARGYAVEWGAPALHMRTPDGRLFDFRARRKRRAPKAAKPAPAAPEEGGRPAARRYSMRWLFLIVAVLAGLYAVGAYVQWLLQQVPEDIVPIPPLTERPIDVDEGPLGGHLKAYAGAAEALEHGDVAVGLDKLDEAKQMAPGLAVLDELPDLRLRLVDALAAAAGTRFLAGEAQLARMLTGELLEIEPDHPEGLALRDMLEQPVMTEVEPVEPSPQEDIRTVARGDSLWAIAGSVYGDPTQWRRIYEANRDTIANPDLIYPDQALVVPALPLRAEVSLDDYRVVRGDSLWRIAGDAYGDPLRWPEIYEANRDKVEDPDLIFPEQVFEIPGI